MKGHLDRLIITARNEELGVVNEQVIDPVRVSLYATLVMELIIPHLPVKGIHESNVNLSVLPPIKRHSFVAQKHLASHFTSRITFLHFPETMSQT